MESIKQSNGSSYYFDDVEVDCGNFCVQKQGKVKSLTPRAFDVLLYLIEQRGHVVEKQELFDRIWKESFVTDYALARAIKEIRQALGDDAGAPRYVETIPKRGYRFIAELRAGNGTSAEEVNEEMPGGVALTESKPAAREAETTSAPSLIGGVKSRTRALLLTFIALLMAGGTIYYFAISRQPAIDSVAVLPFLNVSEDPETEFLSDGITNSIANSLAQLPQLHVTPLSMVARYKGRAVDPQEAGRALGVGAVLVGKLVQRGDRLQIQMELVDVANVARLGGGQYDRKLSDLLSVQREIALEATEKLRLRLSGEEKRRVTNSHTENPEAYQLYLKGQFFWNKRTPEGLTKSIEFYQKAIALDPNYALAYAPGLCGVYGVMGGLNMMRPKEAFERSKQALAKALELDDNLAEAHYAMAVVKTLYDWDWAGAEGEFKRAAELNPQLLPSNHGLYSYYLTMGRLPEAVAEAKRVLALDPLSLPFNRDLAETLYCDRQYDQTIAQCQQMIDMDPNHPMTRLDLGRAYEQKGMYEEAIAELTQSVNLSKRNPQHIGSLGHVYAVSGRRGEALKMLAQLQELSKQRYVPATSMAVIYAGLGEKDRAFESLQKAFEEHDVGLVALYLKASPFWDSLRSDARFGELLRRMGLPA